MNGLLERDSAPRTRLRARPYSGDTTGLPVELHSAFFGEPVYADQGSITYQVGDKKIFFALPYRDDKKFIFDKDRVGLNHLAFRVKTLEELKDFEHVLNKAGIKNSGIQIDKYGNKEFIWFDDPDGIRLEFYLR